MNRKLSIVSVILLSLLFVHQATLAKGGTATVEGEFTWYTDSGQRMPFGTPDSLTITLSTTRDNSYSERATGGWLKQCKFRFTNVPKGVPVELRIECRNGRGQSLRKWITYKIHRNKQDIGPFTIDLAKATIQ